MIEAGGVLQVGEVRNHHHHPCAQAVGQQRRKHGGQHEPKLTVQAAIREVRKQQPQSNGSDEITNAAAGLGYHELTGGHRQLHAIA